MPELDGIEVPALVVQGVQDPFGMPAAGHHRELVTLAGDHSLKADVEGVYRAVADWLPRVLRPLD